MEAFEDQRPRQSRAARRLSDAGFSADSRRRPDRGRRLRALAQPRRASSRWRFSRSRRAQVKNFTPVTQRMLEKPGDGDWLMYRRTYDSWGFSPLDEITRANVGDLELAWARVMTPGRQYITPLAHDGVLYLETPRDIIQALDARTGDLIWEYRYEPAADRAARAKARPEPRRKADRTDRSARHAQHRDLRRQDLPSHARRARDRARRAHRRARVGRTRDRRRTRHHALRRTDRGERQGDQRPRGVRRRRPGDRVHRRARCRHGQGTVALPHDPAPGRARR